MRIPCPAKINPFLAVGPLDKSGYHPLRTEFQAISLFDELEIRPGGRGVEFIGQTVPTENTVSRTLAALARDHGIGDFGVTVRKQIPSEAGLGGASTNAAGVLRWAMRHRGLHRADAEAIAAEIGADVGFFLVGGRAYAEGRGERLTPLPDAEAAWLVLAKPGVGCPTGPAYRALDETPREWRTYRPGEHYNDFERVAPCESLDLLEWLQNRRIDRSGLCGSGSSVYGYAVDEAIARATSEAIRGVGAEWSAVARTLSRAESTVIPPD